MINNKSNHVITNKMVPTKQWSVLSVEFIFTFADVFTIPPSAITHKHTY